jgi:hypothetical protein
MTPEEAVRYGPPAERDHRHDTYGAARIKEVIGTCETPEEAAQELGTTVTRVKQLATQFKIDAPWKRKTETEPEKEVVELTPFETAPNPGQETRAGRPISNCDNRKKFESTISKEMYLAGVEQGWTDHRIMRQAGLKPGVFKNYLRRAKRDWGLEEDFNFRTKTEAEDVKPEDIKAGEPIIAQAKEEVTINQLVKLHDELEDEVENLDYLLTAESGIPLVNSIRLLLDGRRCESARKLKRVHDLFETVKVAI